MRSMTDKTRFQYNVRLRLPVLVVVELIEKQEKLQGNPGHAPPKIFENLHAEIAILVLFE